MSIINIITEHMFVVFDHRRNGTWVLLSRLLTIYFDSSACKNNNETVIFIPRYFETARSLNVKIFAKVFENFDKWIRNNFAGYKWH